MSYIQAGASGGSGGGRTLLTANQNYYVTVTGSDSNDGSIGSPWATTQHAMDFISSKLDLAGFTITVNIRSGTFAGFGIKSTVGDGLIEFFGNGSANMTLGPGPNDGTFNFGECCSANVVCTSIIVLNGMTFKGQAGNFYIANYIFPNDICIGDQTQINTTDVKFITQSGVDIFFVGGASILRTFWVGLGSAVITASATTPDAFALVQQQSTFNDEMRWTFSGAADTYGTAFIDVTDGSVYLRLSSSFTGSANGTRFAVAGGATIDANDAAGTFFPGSSVGTIGQGSTYTGITDFIGVVGSLPSANIQGTRGFVTDALAATFGSAPTGGHGTFVPVYNNGTAWIMG